MFAVPGWAVSSSSLVKEQNRPKNGQKDANSKKRKRVQELSEVATPQSSITPTDVEHKISQEKPRPGHGTKSVTPSSATKSPPAHHKTVQKHANKIARTASSHIASDTSDDTAARSTSAIGPAPSAPPNLKLTPLQAKMRNKLTSARFRHLNETLYTTSSKDALALFTSSPELFAEYHAGFSQQVKESWPQNPVDGYIRSIRTRGALFDSKNGVMPLPRRKTGSCTIADLGCGDAPLARGCQSVVKSLKLKFHNYDLHAPNSFVTKADISNLPLRDGEADIVVFCLSLMGTNWVGFVEEAWRILRGDGKGEVWVAEVKSRFGKVTKGRVVENSVGKRRKKQKSNPEDNDGDPDRYNEPEQYVEDERNASTNDDETDVSNFVKVFTRRGFQLKEGSVNKGNKMFASMVFIKSGIPTTGKHKGLKWNGREYAKQPAPKARFVNGQQDDAEINPAEEAKTLKPCVYKVR